MKKMKKLSRLKKKLLLKARILLGLKLILMSLTLKFSQVQELTIHKLSHPSCFTAQLSFKLIVKI